MFLYGGSRLSTYLVWMFLSTSRASSSSVQVYVHALCGQSNAYMFLANILDTIPAPLLDRMEVIEVSGYVSEEKSMIAERYLGPQAKEASGLKDADVVLDPASVDVLIKYYCRESGVRSLKKHIDKIYRKASLRIVEDLGEDAFPETEAQPTPNNAVDKTVPVQDPPVNETAAPETATPHVSAETVSAEKKVTTEKRRKPERLCRPARLS